MDDPPALLRRMMDAAIAAALPDEVVPPHLPPPPKGRTIVVGAGKASAAMARALERSWPHDRPLEGLVVTRYGHGVDCARIEIAEAAHPVPDEAGLEASRRILELVGTAGPDDLVLALISGGGSALLALPAEGLSLADKQSVNKALLRSGAGISEMNALRKHLSGIKGGRLAAAAYPARMVSLLISDVPGDDPAVIASGPTVADPSTREDALSIIDKYKIDLEDHLRRHLEDERCETPKPGDESLSRSDIVMVATPLASLEAAATIAREAGITPHILGDAIEGEARDVAKVMAGMTRHIVRHGQPFTAPCVLLSGGETTVTIKGEGRGGRNVEFLNALAIELGGMAGVWAVAADTDGVDGAEEIAGAIITPQTLERAEELGFPAKRALADNDAHSLFERLGDQIITGPTLTNVNDFRAILIAP